MSVYVFRNAASEGARELAMALGGRKVRFNNRYGGLYFKRLNGQRVAVQPTAQDIVICWGEQAPQVTRGVRILNGAAIQNKYADAVTLHEAGVPTVEVSQTVPRATLAPPPVDPALTVFDDVRELVMDFPTEFARGRVLNDGVAQLTRRVTALQQALAIAPPQPVMQDIGTWLGRLRNHVGGTDLLTPPARPEFFVKKIELAREFRVHSFLSRSIRAGVKAPREGFNNPHPWIRSYDAGWQIRYDGVTSQQRHRELAHRATQALGLDFGAVDIGEKVNGDLVVLEVNRAPGLEGGTVTRYSNAILRWRDGELEAEE